MSWQSADGREEPLPVGALGYNPAIRQFEVADWGEGERRFNGFWTGGAWVPTYSNAPSYNPHVINWIADRQGSPEVGDFGVDLRVPANERVSVMGHPLTHVYADVGWLRVRSVGFRWVAEYADELHELVAAAQPIG